MRCVEPADSSSRQVEAEFRRLIGGGARIRPAGTAKSDPLCLLSLGYTPKYKIELFDTVFYLSNVRQNPDLRFFVAFVLLAEPQAAGPARARRKRVRSIYPRIFYKDVSLVWRSASHFVRSENENWVGKGAVRTFVDDDGVESISSAEETTDLPLEVQAALETLVRKVRRPRRDDAAIALVLRRGPDDRIEPYRDFTEPRRIAAENPRNLINRGRPIARFTRQGDPRSLRFVAGFEPDFDLGAIDVSKLTSRLYGGAIRRYRLLSRNRKVQFMFMAGPKMVWIVPPQATTTALTSFGVRPIDVIADEDLSIPGYEYHFLDDSSDPPVWVSQIPPGFVGPVSELDDSRCSASAWIDQMPVVREFREKVLRRRARGSPGR